VGQQAAGAVPGRNIASDRETICTPDYAPGERSALGNTIPSAGYDRQHAMDERSARQAAASGNAARSGNTVSTASSI
jgi:hypothetical protein